MRACPSNMRAAKLMKIRKMLHSVALVALGMVLFVTGCDDGSEEATEIVRPVRAIRVADGESIVSRSFPGRAAATQEVNAAFRVSGRIIERPIRVGDELEQGELIAALDPSTFEAEVARARADVDSANAALKRNQLELDRQTKLLEEGWVTQSRVDTVQAQTDTAQASVLAARSALERAELDLSYTVLTAPFDGIVVDVLRENFEEVRAQEPIARIVDTSQVEFWVAIPESMISQVPYVEGVQVEFDAFPGRPLDAAVKEISREASQTTRAFDVNLIMDQPEDFKVLPGMAGRATGRRALRADEVGTAGFEVPLDAVFNPGGETEAVWVVDASNETVALREVVTRETTQHGILVTGIEPGEWVVTAGVEFLREGQKVRLNP